MTTRRKIGAALALAAVLLAGGRAGAAEVVAAGDIATGGNGDLRTSNLVIALAPDEVLTLGDNAYPSGTPGQFDAYYDPTWGRFRNITRPSPGNHDWMTSGAAGYEGYFGVQAGELHWFATDGWLIVSMDSNGTSASRTAQRDELAAILAADDHACELLYWHHPRYSSGEHGSSTRTEPWWVAASAGGVDVVLNGHDHDYERFAPTRGIRQFVVGMGGVGTRPFASVAPGSAVRITGNENRGVLDLELTPGAYAWRYLDATGGPATGIVRDSGEGTCHA